MKMIHVSDVIQIAPAESVAEPFQGKLAFVAKVRANYILALVVTFQGVTLIRLKEDEFQFVGSAPYVPISLLKQFMRDT